MGKPWEDVPDLWKNEKAYCNWLRGQIRRMWSRHPVKTGYIKQRPTITRAMAFSGVYKLGTLNLSANTKKLYCCEMCEMWFPAGKMEVDHLNGGEGFSTYEEFLGWQKRVLFVGFEDLRHICKACHLTVTLSQRYKCPLKVVPMYQARAEFRKWKVTARRAHLEDLGIKVYEKATAAAMEIAYCTYLESQYGYAFDN